MLRAYATMRPVLHARESIHRINEMSVAFGSMSEHDGRSFQRELQEMARREGVRPHRPASIEEIQSLSGGSTKVQVV